MSELRLHRDLYPGASVDQAIGLYERHAEIVRADEGEHTVLRITSARPGRAERVAAELGNYALGLAIHARRAAAAPPKEAGAR